VNQKQKSAVIAQIKAKAKTIREIINLRCELLVLTEKTNELWTNRARFYINYFNNKGFDVFADASNWDNTYEKAFNNARDLYNNKGGDILGKQSLTTNRMNPNWEFEIPDEEVSE